MKAKILILLLLLSVLFLTGMNRDETTAGLVQDGRNLITNGTFDTDADWNIGINTTISGGTINFNYTPFTTKQETDLIVGHTYKLSLECTDFTSGSTAISIDKTGGSEISGISEVKTYSTTFVNVIDNPDFKIEPLNFVGSLDNISVVDITNQLVYSPNPIVDGTFVSTWKTDNAGTSNDNQITLPLEASGTYDFSIYWGDGTKSDITAYDQVLQSETVAVTHSYPIAGTYEVQIDGVINGFRFNDGGDKAKITDISQWGDLLLGNLARYFYGCANLTVTATDILDVSGVSNFAHMFHNCTSLTTLNVSNWDVSNSMSFSGTFYGCSELITLDVSSWDTSDLKNISSMFRGCIKLKSLDMSGWDTSKITTGRYLFLDCSALTTVGDLSLWDTGLFEDMNNLFRNCVSLISIGDISGWDTSSVTDMFKAFDGDSSLTGLDISGFDLTELTDATDMLNGTTISNYSDVLIAWGAQATAGTIQSTVSMLFGAGSNTYSGAAAIAAKAALEAAPYNWDITDGGVV